MTEIKLGDITRRSFDLEFESEPTDEEELSAYTSDGIRLTGEIGYESASDIPIDERSSHVMVDGIDENLLESIIQNPFGGPSEEEHTYISVLKRDVNISHHSSLTMYHNKILTEADINHLFTGAMLKILRRCLSKKNILMIKKSSQIDDCALCKILITNTIQTILDELEIKFTLQIIYPDHTIKYIDISYTVYEKEKVIRFYFCKEDKILCATNTKSDLLHLNILYSHNDSHGTKHRLLKTAIKVGDYGAHMKIDADTIQSAVDRIHTSWRSAGIWKGTLPSSIMKFLYPIGTPPPPQKMQKTFPPNSQPPIESKKENDKEYDLKGKTKCAREPVTDVYTSLNGWHEVRSATKLMIEKCHETYDGNVAATILVNFDDSLCEAQRQAASKIKAQVMRREYKVALAASNRLVQMSEFDTLEEIESDNGCTSESSRRDEFESIMECYYTIYRYRRIFDPQAFAHIVIDNDTHVLLQRDPWRSKFEYQGEILNELKSKLIFADMLDQESRRLIYRVVHLKNIVFECSLPMALVSFQATMQKNVFDKLVNSIADSEEMREIARKSTELSLFSRFNLCGGRCHG